MVRGVCGVSGDDKVAVVDLKDAGSDDDVYDGEGSGRDGVEEYEKQ